MALGYTDMDARTLFELGYPMKQIAEMTGMHVSQLYPLLADLVTIGTSWTRGPRPTNLLGKKYGKLTIEEYVSRIRSREYMVRCLCDCGESAVLSSKEIVLGKITSCGCEEQPKSGPVMIGNQTLYQYAKQHNIHYNVLLKRLLDGKDIKGEEI